MCLLALCTERKLTKEEFKNSWNGNSHGSGFAWVENNKIKFKKGFMKIKDAWNFYRDDINTFPHVVHFRLSSAGSICEKLTHPFVIGKSSHENNNCYEGTKDVLFHNGHISNWVDFLNTLVINKIKIDPIHNDTMILAILLGFYKKSGLNYIDLLKHITGKFVILKSDNTYEKYGDFIEEKGVFFSNHGYKSYTNYFTKKRTLADDYDYKEKISDIFNDDDEFNSNEYWNSHWDKVFNRDKRESKSFYSNNTDLDEI